jgi:hypothetical protein
MSEEHKQEEAMLDTLVQVLREEVRQEGDRGETAVAHLLEMLLIQIGKSKMNLGFKYYCYD